MLDKTPHFHSSIPEHLLANANPEMKWIMENMSVLTQKSDYLVTTQQEQSAKLDLLDSRAEYTNGKIAMAITEIDDLQKERDAQKEDLADIIATKKFIIKYFFNKWGLVITVIFILGVISLLNSAIIRNLVVNFLA